MNISWNDLNNVQAPGDYPFRDGTITITFAEVVVWKEQPGARFELMRKHPLQAQAHYVLGRQCTQSAQSGLVAQAESKTFYQSSNGDSWSLTEDPVSRALTVIHRPNLASGGQISSITIDEFLRKGEGPEHLALRQLVATKTTPSTILIAYDLHYPGGQAYDDLITTIKSFGNWWHHLETVWVVRCAHTPAEVQNRLKSHIGKDDQLLVIDVSAVKADWLGINDAGNEWLKSNIFSG